METQEVSQFKQYILHGHWPKAEAALTRLGVNDEASLLVGFRTAARISRNLNINRKRDF